MTGASFLKQVFQIIANINYKLTKGHGENTSSIAWLQENTLIAGMGSRYLKVFDIRGISCDYDVMVM